jgi:hypothetical protein
VNQFRASKCLLTDNEGKELFRVIEGGRCWSSENQKGLDGPAKVREEARRRLREAGIDGYEARERITGVAMPPALKMFKLQVEFTMTALSTLSPLPDDYMRDGYWPALVEGATRLQAARIQR